MAGSDRIVDDDLMFTSWQQWLGVREFYIVGLIYMTTRLVVNLSQVLIPFYLLDYLGMDQSSITSVPFVLYMAQFVAAFFTTPLTARVGRRGGMLVGAVLVVAPCALMWVLNSTLTDYIYPVVATLGLGCAIIMVISQQLQADLVGLNTSCGSFVYGAHSFTDKVANGVAIFVVQRINGDRMVYVREAIVFVPAGAIALAVVLMLWLDLNQLSGGPGGTETESAVTKSDDAQSYTNPTVPSMARPKPGLAQSYQQITDRDRNRDA